MKGEWKCWKAVCEKNAHLIYGCLSFGYENLLELHARRAARKRISADDRERLEWYGMDLDFDPEWLSIEECREIVEDFNHS